MIEELIKRTTFVDTLLILIGALAIVSFWRGIWGLMDIYLYPKSHVMSFTISVVMGLIALFMVGAYKGRRQKNKKQ